LADGRYVIDAFQLSYLGTGRDVLHFDAPAGLEPAPPVVVADPDFNYGTAPGNTANGPFGRLPGTRAEASMLADLLAVEPVVGSAALAGPLKTAWSSECSPRILHLATHGFFLPDQTHDPSAASSSAEFDKKGGGTLARFRGSAPFSPLHRSGLALAGANTWLRSDQLPPEAERGASCLPKM
jgi:hypothetical protein